MRNVGLIILSLGLLIPAKSEAFETTKTCYPSGIYKCRPNQVSKQVLWSSRCIGYTVNEDGTDDLPPGPDGKVAPDTLASITNSFETWNNVECADIQFIFTGLTTSKQTTHIEDAGCSGNVNVVVWREAEWPHSPDAYALTSTTFDTKTGIISDADVEMNGDHHEFSIVDVSGAVDIQNTLTHEVGHFLGLDHSTIVRSTMFGSAAVGETKKRTLDVDDIAGICEIYPIEVENRVCDTLCEAPEDGGGVEDDGCCSTVTTHQQTPLGLMLAALFLGLVISYSRRAS